MLLTVVELLSVVFYSFFYFFISDSAFIIMLGRNLTKQSFHLSKKILIKNVKRKFGIFTEEENALRDQGKKFFQKKFRRLFKP